MIIQAAGSTHTGRKRRGNEDSFLVASDRGLFVVADGMGGHYGGEIASALVIESFQKGVPTTPLPGSSAEQTYLAASIRKAHNRIIEINEADDTDMGTTVVALHVREDLLVTMSHLGDSRIYGFRRGKLTQLTKDHSLAQDLLDQGYTGPLGGRYASVITKAVGLKDLKTIPSKTMQGKSGDLFLLCSDGLSNELSDEELIQILSQKGTPESLVETLIQKANENGGRDNITAIVVIIL